MTTQLSIDILCDWVGYAPAYRLFIDGDLITERTYIWDNQSSFVREHVSVDLESGTHCIKLEPVVVLGMQAMFSIKQVTINNNPVALIDNTFII